MLLASGAGLQLRQILFLPHFPEVLLELGDPLLPREAVGVAIRYVAFAGSREWCSD
jgi:hypothetical protein